ncbi:hypothetical protein FRC14_004006 [Serendipita sp. 396]|nr:hypothetical protein FRC14_004006 [Serendipita sp. 396]
MRIFIFQGISVELPAWDDHRLDGFPHLVLEVKLNNGFAHKAKLQPRESSPGVWDTNESLMLPELAAHFAITGFRELGGAEHRLLASKELFGPDLCNQTGEPAEVLLDGHENHPNIVLKTKVVAANAIRQTPGGEPNDINNIIAQLQERARLVADDHPDKPRLLYNLGGALLTRFKRLGSLEDLNSAIQQHKAALNLTPDGHPHKLGLLGNLANSLRTRFQRLGNLDDINDAIIQEQAAVDLIPDGQPDKATWLNNLGNSLLSRFERLGILDDIDNSIIKHQAAVNTTTDGHPDKPRRLNNLGSAFRNRFNRLGNLDDINNAIESHRAAVNLTPDSHPDKPKRLNNLGNSFLGRFGRFGDLDDLDNAILQHKAAVYLTPDGHPDKPKRLSNLATSLLNRFQRLGNLDDLDDAITQHQVAIDLTTDLHPEKPIQLNNIGIALRTRFERLGNYSDVDNAIQQHQAAVNLTPNGHPAKPNWLSNLGNALLIRFDRLGNLDDIDNAISKHQDAVNLTPDDHRDKPSCLNNLGSSLLTRFERLGNLDDIDKAIMQHQAAVDLTPDNHPDKPKALNNLGNSLIIRFERLGKSEDADNGIARHQEAVDRTPDGHPGKPRWLGNIGNSLLIRFERLGNLDDIDKAIMQHQAAVDLTPDDHSDRPSLLSNLGNSLLTRFERLGNIDDIANAVKQNQAAADLTPDDHPLKCGLLSNLGNSLVHRFRKFNHSPDAEAAVAHLSAAASSPVGPPSVRLTAAKKWIGTASIANHTSLLDACECAITVIPLVAWLGLPITDRHQQLAQIGGIVRDVAAIAISLDQRDKALEWLEQGRFIVWTQILQLRTPVDQLRDVEPDLADHLLRLSRLLDQGIHDSNPQSESKRSPEQEARQYRTLATERDELVEKVRSLPNFNDFLRPSKLQRLAEAAKSGPVVVVNVSEMRCDALALASGVDEVVHIPLPKLMSRRVTQLQVELKSILKSSGVRQRAVRDEDVEVGGDEGCKRILGELWDHLVNPVLHSLKFKPGPDTLPRMWWCVTGPLAFLPIHAAGVYDTGDSSGKIQDYTVVSYAPTISALLERSDTPVHRPSRHLSAIEPSSGASYIPNTEKELEYIRLRLQNRDHVVLHKVDATKERVMKEMQDCNWLHLACHGTQNAINPTKSALLLHGGKLTLEEIIRLNLPHAEFAFLSACQTMMGDENLSDEAVHIAGAMSLAGYRSVVATMWSIEDALAPKVADEFYARLLKDGERPDNRKAAEALYFSVKKLREEKDVRMLSWLPFVHLGI